MTTTTTTTTTATPPLRIAVIGAGPSGITAAKNVLEAGLGDGLVVFEKSDAIGGNWVYRSSSSSAESDNNGQDEDEDDHQHHNHSSVYETTHSISSRYLSEYEDFPFSPNVADYPHHSCLCRYFQDYAQHFGVMEKVRYHVEVVHAQRNTHDGRWQLKIRNTKKKNEKMRIIMMMTAR